MKKVKIQSFIKDIEFELKYKPSKVVIRRYEKLCLGGFRQVGFDEVKPEIDAIMDSLKIKGDLINVISIEFPDAFSETLEISICIY